MLKKVKKEVRKPVFARTKGEKSVSLKKKTKKTTAKKATKSLKKSAAAKADTAPAEIQPKLVIKKNSTWLNKADLEYFRKLLIDKLNELTGDVGQIESGALKSSRLDASGDLSSMPIHMADIGSDNYEQEFALGLMDSERKIVLEILAALRRIQDGTYGVCEGTGNPISRARLEGIPWARYCVKYAQVLEEGSTGEKESRVSEDTSSAEESDRRDEGQAETDDKELADADGSGVYDFEPEEGNEDEIV